jgi:hypothetical protein
MRNKGYGENAIKSGRKRAGVKAYLDGFGKDGVWMVHIPEAIKDDESEPENPWA